MIIYRDLLDEGDTNELASDSYPMKLDPTGVFLEITGKIITETQGDIDTGANPSQEEEEQAAESTSTTGINIVLAQKLQEIPEVEKKDLKIYFKAYLKKVTDKLKTQLSEDDLKEWQKQCQVAVMNILKSIDDYTFYIGETEDIGEVLKGNRMLIFCRWDGETPVLCYLKQGLREEKF